MSKKNLIILITSVVVVLVVAVVAIKKLKTSRVVDQDQDNAEVELPINTIPLEERPFITLAPDSTGRTLNLTVSSAPSDGELEYEMVYNAEGKQEGVFGRLELGVETQPINKALLLGSKSAGGKVTYHEGVTGGSLTVTYGDTRLKESFSYLSFDPEDPTLLSTDGRFIMTLPKTALKKDTRVLTMKTFGYEKTGLPEDAKVVSGPYAIYYAQDPKGQGSVELKLPAGEHTNPTIYSWDGKSWSKQKSTIKDDSVTSPTSGNAYIVVE